MNWKLTFRHLTRHWRLNLVLFTIMILGAALLTSLPMLALSIAGESLAKSLESAPVFERNILIQGKTTTDEPPDAIIESLDPLIQEIIAVREGDVVGYSTIYKSAGEDLNLYPATLVLNLKSFSNLDEHVRVLEGRLPVEGSTLEGDDLIATYEAAIGTEVAQRLGLALGDVISPAGDSYQLKIVGVVEPLDATAAIWWGDRQMTPFSAWRRIHISPDIDEWNVSLLVHPRTMVLRVYHNQYWRIILDHKNITASEAPALRIKLIELQSSLSDDEMVLSTSLIDLIAQFEEALALAQVSLLLLTFQSLFAVFYLLGMFGNFLVEGSRTELATLSGRGFSRAQITGLFARSTIILALLAGVLAPLVARAFLSLWATWQGYPAPTNIPPESWWLALATSLFSWVFLVVSIYRAGQSNLFHGQGQGVRMDIGGTLTQRHIIWDIFLLALGGLAYWQLTQGGSITNEVSKLGEGTGTAISDLVLLLGPSLLLLAISLIIIRLLPFLWRLLARISRRGQGLTWNLVFTRLARQPVGPNQITLLISLTAGLTLFASAFSTSIENWQQSMARYVTGADIRIRQPLLKPFDAAGLPYQPTDTQQTEVIRTEATILLDEYLRLDFDLLAVDPETLPNVISYPPGVSSFSIEQIMGVLHSSSPDVLPIVIASSIHTNHLNVGDPVTLELNKEMYPAEVVGIIINFPLLDNLFAITDLAQFSGQAYLEALDLTNQATREVWLSTDPSQQKALITQLNEAGLGTLIVGNSQSQLEVFKNNLVFREVATAFDLNAMILIPLSVVGFFLIQLFSIQRRTAEFNILQTIGLSKSQLRSLLLREGVLFILLGTLLGIGIGYGLTIMMQPFLAQILPALSGNLVLKQVLVNGTEAGIRFLILIGFYGIALLILMISAVRYQRNAQF